MQSHEEDEYVEHSTENHWCPGESLVLYMPTLVINHTLKLSSSLLCSYQLLTKRGFILQSRTDQKIWNRFRMRLISE